MHRLALRTEDGCHGSCSIRSVLAGGSRALIAATAAQAAPTAASSSSSASRSSPPGLDFRGRSSAASPASRTTSAAHVFYALSDDQTNVRFYTLRVDVSAGVPAVQILAVTTFRDATGQPFAPLSVDPEGLALTKADTLVITSEGFATRLIDPWVREFSLDGRQLRSLPVPSAVPACGGRHARRAPEPRLRERLDRRRTGVSSSPAPRRPRAGRPARHAYGRQPRPPAPLRPPDAASSTGSTSTGQIRSRTARSRDPVRRQRPRRAAAAQHRRVLLSMERSFSVGAPGTGTRSGSIRSR